MFPSCLTRFAPAAFAAALLTPHLLLAADPTPPPSPRTADSAVTPVNRNPRRHVQFLSRIKDGPVDLLFLGDSITDFWPKVGEFTWLKFAPYHPADFGVSAERTEDVLWRIQNGELDGIHPKAVVVMIGTNNIGTTADEQPAWAAAGVHKILDVIHAKLPDTKVLLLAVFPRDLKESDHRKRNDEVNVELAKLADAKTRFLDIGHVFLAPNGEIPADVMPDHLHPSAKGYDLWYDAIKPTVDEMMK